MSGDVSKSICKGRFGRDNFDIASRRDIRVCNRSDSDFCSADL